jgi:hypothetical protein
MFLGHFVCYPKIKICPKTFRPKTKFHKVVSRRRFSELALELIEAISVRADLASSSSAAEALGSIL